MKNYLLLRDNKQSGPHSFEELLGMGLRTYDLLWVDGKSAAWRYPAEFPEFKEHAPAAPEQPFDRFFRKPVADQAILPVQQEDSSATELPTLTRFMREQEEDRLKETDRVRFEFPEKVEKDEPQSSSSGGDDEGNRYVAVSLPAQDADRPIVVIGHAEKNMQQGISGRSMGHEEPVGKPVSALFPERDPLATPRKPAPAHRQPWLQYAAILVGILSFMGLGILIGIKWSRERDAGGRDNAATLQDDRPAASPNTSVPITPQASPADSGASKPTLLEGRSARKQRKDTNANKPVISGDIVHATIAKELDPAVLQEESRKRREAEDKERTRGNIAQLVGLQADKYKVGLLGGISDMEVTVNNGSGYALDEVVVEVDYLLSNKKVYKTETLRFIDLAPHGNKTITLPRTGRGVKAESRVMRINSRDLELSWSR